jgi:DNA polymerase III subunit beta
MKVVISKAELGSLIGKIQSIVPAKPSLPILGNVLIEAIDGQLIMSATDLTVSMRAEAEAKVFEPGAITLPARRLFQLVRELTAPQVEIECPSPEIAHIRAGSSYFKIHGMHKGEFPALPDLSAGISFTVSEAMLKEMLSRTAFAAARDDSRQILNGILLQSVGKVTTLIGTDGKRLAKIHTEVEIPETHSASYVVPLKAVEEIIRILNDHERTCKLTLTNDKFGVEIDNVLLITKLLSGQYPDVSRVIPTKSEAPIILHREELISLLRQVALFTSDSSNSVRFTFEPGEVRLSATSGDIGEGKVSMAVNYQGPKLDIAFNPNYFLDILRHSKDETVFFDVSDSYNPGLVTDSSKALFVIMPMRLEV